MNLIIEIKNNINKEKYLEFTFSQDNKENVIFEIQFTNDSTNEISLMFEHILNSLYENCGNLIININDPILEDIGNFDKTIIESYIELLKIEIESSKSLIQKIFLN